MSALQHIHIQSDSLAGIMMAAWLGRHLPKSYQITLEQTQDLADAPLYEIAPPRLRAFHRALGLKELDFVTTSAASFRLGEQYDGFGPSPYVLPFAPYGYSIDGVEFHQFWHARRGAAPLSDLEKYSLPAMAMRAEKFLPPDAKGRPIVSDYTYGYHLNVKLYAERVLALAQSFGVALGEAKTADLTIDATHSAPRKGWQSWAEYGLAQSYSARKIDAPLSTKTHYAAHEGGYEARYTAQNGATALRISFAAEDTPLTTGRRAQAWTEDTLFIGGAASVFEPLMGLPMLSAILDCERLLSLLPPNLSSAPERAEYNRRWAQASDRIRDYQVLHRITSANAPKHAQATPEAENKRAFFQSCGRMVMLDGDDLMREQWIPMLLGQGVTPARHDLLANNMNTPQADAELAELENVIARAAQNMPSHADFIARTCPAPQAANPEGKHHAG